MTAQTYVLISNPWVLCQQCQDQVFARVGDRNLPCRCVAPAESICITWSSGYGCRCDTADDAELFQAAVEHAQRHQLAGQQAAADQHLWPHPAPEHHVPVPQYPEVDKLVETAERSPSPLRGLAWLALVFLLALLFLGINQL